MRKVASEAARTVRRQDSSTEQALTWIEQTLGRGKRSVGAADIGALMTPLGWELTFPHGARTQGTMHVESTERLLLVRYAGSPFTGRYQRDPSDVLHGPLTAAVELVHSGRGVLRDDEGECEIRAGDALLHPPFRDRTVEWLGDEGERTLVLLVTRVPRPWHDPVLHRERLVLRHAPLIPAATLLVDVLLDEPEPLVAMSAAQALYGLVGATLTATAGRPARPDAEVLRGRVHDVLRARFMEPDLDASEVARELRVSRRHLFAQFSGTADRFATVLRDVRLDHAADLLAGGAPTLTVRRIARECGFGGPAQLSRAFRERFGVTPSEFRSAARRPVWPETS